MVTRAERLDDFAYLRIIFENMKNAPHLARYLKASITFILQFIYAVLFDATEYICIIGVSVGSAWRIERTASTSGPC